MSLLQAVIVFVSFITLASSATSTIKPSISNSSGDYYISSETTLASKTITCSAPNCHIICDTTCQNIAISASQSSSLAIDCLTSSSCKKAQLKSGPKDTLTINCIAPKACANATFQFNHTSNADITCRYNATHEEVRLNGTIIGSCKDARFYGQQSNKVSVDCNGFDCYQSIFHVNNSQTAEFRMHNPSFMSYTKTTIFGGYISNALIVKCLHSNSCRENKIYCPQNADCDLHCKDQFACAQDIYIPNKDYDHLYLNVSSIYNTDIHCLDTNHMSIMEYRSDAKVFGCRDYTLACCPPFNTLGATITTCKSGTDCGVLCEPCKNDVFDAANATSLTVKCIGESGCEGKTINCGGSSCDIQCDGLNACKDVRVNIEDTNTLTVSCLQDSACAGLHIWPKQQNAKVHIDNVLLSCKMTESCANVTVGYGIIVGTLNVDCTATKSCEGMQFLDKTPTINNELIYLSTTITNELSINCGASLACHKVSAHFVSSSEAQNHIICNNTAISSNATGACYRATFELYGNSQNAGDWNVTCNNFDCQHIAVHTGAYSTSRYSSNMLRMKCDAPYSCASSSIYADSSNGLHLKCTHKGSCFHSVVRGASKTAKATQIVCGEAENSCASMAISSSSAFKKGYVSLLCPSGKEYKSSCDKIIFNCDTNYYPIYVVHKTCYLHYDDDAFTYDGCATVEDETYPVYGRNISNCCPLFTDHNILKSTAANDSESNSTIMIVAVIFGCILVLALVMCLVWYSFASQQKKRRVDISALLSGDINDESQERGVGIVVDAGQDRDSYLPPDASSTTTELTVQ